MGDCKLLGRDGGGIGVKAEVVGEVVLFLTETL
jgi:hypothetical protein